MRFTGAEAVTHALAELGVEVVFGVPGAHNLALWEALRRSGTRVIGVRHEQAAGYAADGYARATGRLGVALTTTGPGAANVVCATGEAWASGSPVLVVATDVPAALRRPGGYRGVLHETTDQAGFFRPVTKAALHADDPAGLTDATVRAGTAALAAPRRPVYLEIPTDVVSAPATDQVPAEPPPAPEPFRDEAAIAEAVGILTAAQRPLLWAGGGATAAGAGPLVAAVAERLGAPVLTSYGGRGLLPPDHPLLVGLSP